MSDEDLLCFCMCVSKQAIESAVHSGKEEIDILKAELGCCMGCGTCEGRISDFVDQIKTQMAAEAQAQSGDDADKAGDAA